MLTIRIVSIALLVSFGNKILYQFPHFLLREKIHWVRGYKDSIFFVEYPLEFHHRRHIVHHKAFWWNTELNAALEKAVIHKVEPYPFCPLFEKGFKVFR